MVKPSIALSELLEKGADSDLLREMIQHIVQRVMDMDVENICAACYGERSPDRQNSRNGYRERLWETRAGAVNVKIPKLRSGSYFPPFLEPRRTAEKALAAVIYEQLPLCKAHDRPALKGWLLLSIRPVCGTRAAPLALMGSANPRPCTFARLNTSWPPSGLVSSGPT